MVEKNLKKILNFLYKIFEKIKPRFSFHYVAYTTLFVFIIFSVVGLVQATTPNPGHPWIELGDGVFSVTNNQTALRTYTFPDANATVLTTNSAVTVAQGGTGITSIADGDLLVTTGANTFGTLTIGAGQSVRRNSGGTAFEAFTPSTGTVTGVSVVTANGFAGSATSGATPAITITTSVSGMLKGNGTAISAATDGTDFLSPSTGWKLDGQTLGAKKTLGSTDAYDIGFLTNNSERMTILSDGKVGIGTTTPTQKLSIAGGSIYLADTYGITWSNGSESIYGLGSAGSYSLQFNTYTGSSLTEKMRILGSGNVGIGTTNPGKKLSVQGDGVGHASSASGQFEITGTTEPLNKISFGIADNANDSTTYGYIFAAKQGISYRNLILNGLGGSVGIGTTNPTNTLSFGGDVDRTIGMERLSTNNYGKSLTISAGGGGASGTDNFGGDLYLKSGFSTGAGTSAIHFFTQTAGTTGITDRTTTEKMTILGSGNVGIGTTAPVSALHVNNASPYLAISSTDTVLSADENVGSLVFYSNDASANSSGGVGAIRSFVTSEYNTSRTPSYMSFYTHSDSTGPNGSVVGGAGLLERMRIDSAGNVGIGITNPGYKLVVSDATTPTLRIEPGGNVTADPTLWLTDTSDVAGFKMRYDNDVGATYFDNLYDNANGSIYFRTKTVGTPVNALTISGAGNVGIGITNPSSYTLQVSGTGGFTTSVNSPIFQGQAAAVTFGNASYASTIAGSALTISPTSWTATPTISGLITATSGITSNGTATFNGVTNIGDGGDAIAVNSNTWDISSAGAVTGVTTLATSGKITQGGYLNLTNDNLLHNGDFETNSLDGWNVAGAGTTTVVTGGYAGNYTSQFSGSVSFASDDYIPVDPTRDVIQLEAYVQKTVAGTTPGTFYLGYYAYNANKTVITTAPCGSYCYFAASGYIVPVDSTWHKFSATTTGEGTSYPNFPVGTKYIRVMSLVNFGGSLDTVTLIDHISVKKINNGPLFVGNNFSASNLLDQHQVSKIYTTSGNILTFEPSSGGTINLNSATSNPISLTTSNNNHLNLMPNGTGRIGIGTTTPTAILHLKAGTATASTAPLKFTSGTNLTSAEAGAMEYDGTNLYFTPSGTTRKTIAYTSDLTSGYIPYTGGTSNVDLGVHNLTVDTTTLFVDATNHRVGVGTTSPISKLQLGNNWTANPGSTNTIYLGSSGFAVSNIAPEQIITTNSTSTTPGSNIGLSLHNSTATAGAYAPLLVFSTMETGATSYNGAISAIGSRTVTGSGAGGNYIDGEMMFYTAPTAGSGLLERMRISESGNVGIGTTAPSYKTDILIDNATTNAVTSVLRLGHTTSGTAAIGIGTGILFSAEREDTSLVSAGSIRSFLTNVSSNEASSMSFHTVLAGTLNERMRIDSAGNVGIGTTSPSAPLTVSVNNDTDSAGLKIISNPLVENSRPGIFQYGLRTPGGIAYSAQKAYLGNSLTDPNMLLGFDMGVYGNVGPTTHSVYYGYFGSASNAGYSNAAIKFTPSNRVGIALPSTDSPGAILHIGPGVATGGGAPLKFTAGTNLTNPVAGAMEYDGTRLYFTPASTRETLAFTSDLTSGYIPYTGGTSNVDLGVHNLTVDTNTLFVDATNHKVGIGTTTPNNSLHIVRNITNDFTATLLRLQSTGTTSSAFLQIDRTSTARMAGINYALSGTTEWFTGTYYNDGSGQTNFGIGTDYTAVNQKLIITSTGNVGIGMTNPSRPLDVYGYARIGKSADTASKTLTVAGNLNFDTVVNPTNAQVQGMVLTNAGAGNIEAGKYYYTVMFTTAEGDTGAAGITASAQPNITLATPSQVSITNIPVSTDPRVTSRKIYRSQAGTDGDYYYLYYIGTIADNTTTTYTDNSARSTASTDWFYNKNNTTAGIIYRDGVVFGRLGDYVTAFGSGAMANINRGSTSAAFGSGALGVATTGDSNQAFGHSALSSVTTGASNVGVGYASGQGNQTGGNNTSIGYNSLRNDNSYSYSNNSAFGVNALYGLSTSNDSNIGLGYSAGGYAQGSTGIYLGYFAGNQSTARTVGAYNIVIGATAGRTLGTGTDNIIIGRSVELATPNSSFQINIGNLLYGTGWATGSTPATSGKIGIGLTTPTAVLHLKAGTATASTAPLKFTSGTNLTSAEAGAMEYDGTQLYFSPSTTRNILAQVSGGTALTAGSIPYVTTSGYLTQNNANLFWDNANTRLGIGTTTPARKLHVVSSNPIRLEGASNQGIEMLPGASYYSWLVGAQYNISDTLEFTPSTAVGGTTFSTPVMVIKQTGNVGIGTTAPTYKLDVKGATVASGIRSDMGFDIYPVPDPTAPTGVVSSGGSVDTGYHYYAVTYYTAVGETHSVFSGQITTTAGNNTVTLTIPVSTDPRVVGRKIYRTKAGAYQWNDYLLATVADNTSTSYVDTASDSSLSGSSGVSYFKVNTTSRQITLSGTKSMMIDSKATYFGLNAGLSVTTGGRNSFFGTGAGQSNTTGTDNNFFGYSAGSATSTGGANVGMGYSAMGSNTTGSNNTAIGHDALLYNQTGSNNTAIGYSSLFGVSGNSTSYNTGLGYGSGFMITTGGYNTFLGANTAYNLTTGTYNLFAGYQAGRYISGGSVNNTTGASSVFLGADTKPLADGDTNEIVIGYSATGIGSNSVTLGNDSITKTALKGNVGIGTTAPQGTLNINRAAAVTAISAANNYISIGNSLADANNSAKHIIGFGYTNGGANTYNPAYIGSVTETGTGQTNEAIVFGTRAVTTDTLPTERMRIDGSGNVGIGTTAPTGKLHVVGSNAVATDIIKLSSGSATMLVNNITSNPNGPMIDYDINSSTTLYDFIRLGSGTMAGATAISYQNIITSTPTISMASGSTAINNLNLQPTINQTGTATGITRGLYINPTLTSAPAWRAIEVVRGDVLFGTTSGNVGIGTTAPTSILALGGTAARTIQMERNTTAATAGQGLTISSGGAIAGTADLAGGDLNLKSGISTGTGTSALRFFTATAGTTGSTDNAPTEKMTILGSGNVGIGTTAPVTKLHVVGASTFTDYMSVLSGLITAGGGAADTMNIRSNSGKSLSFGTNGTYDNVFINTSGNVGIGTTTPTAYLNIKAGTATAGTAPLKFTSGVNLTTAEAGAMEYDGTELYFTPSGTTRETIAYMSDFPITIVNSSNLFSTKLSGTGSGVTATTDSIFLGVDAGNGATGANNSNFLGLSAGKSATGATYANFLGSSAGEGATGASYSNFLGQNSGLNASSASYANFFGANAGSGATNASNSNFLGASAGETAVSASSANFFGYQAGSGATYANDSNFFGYQAGLSATYAANSNFIGGYAGSGASYASGSNFFGSGAGSGASYASGSNFFGAYAGDEATNASHSNLFGFSAGGGATDASNSNFFGQNAGYLASSANNSNFFGQNAGDGATNSAYSNFFGKSAGISATDASYSNFIGHYSGYTASSAANSNFIGYYAGASATTASNSIFIGKKAGFNDTVDNTANANNWSILIGYNTRTGGYGNSILLGGSSSTTAITNTKANQFMLADTITDVRWRGVEYTLPSAQGSANSIISNDGSGTLSWTNTPTLTSLTTPLILGGTGTTQDLTLQTTSGVGTTGADMHFLVGNNGATEAMTILNDGKIGIGTTAPTQQLGITKNFLLPKTVGTTPYGIIYKGADPFIHDFNYGYNGTTTTAGENLFIGNGAGNFTMGSTATMAFHASYNVGVGTYSLRNNTTGQQNVAVGMSSSQSITTGSYNTAVGTTSMANVSSGINNSAFGMASMVAGNGDYRVAIGSWALSGGGGSYSTTVGALSLMATNSSGTYNVGLGYQAGRYISGGSVSNTTGASSVFLGANTKPLADGDTNEIVIGYNTTGIGSNSVTLGNDSITKTALKGLVGIGTTNPTSKLEIYGSGNTNTTSSLTVKNSSGNTGLFVRDDGYTGIGTGTLSGSKLTVADDITIKGIESSGTNINLLTASAEPKIVAKVSNTDEWSLGINSVIGDAVSLFAPNKKIILAGNGTTLDFVTGGGETAVYMGESKNAFVVWSNADSDSFIKVDTANYKTTFNLGDVGIGVTSPTAKLHIGSGGGLAPLKFTSGVNLTIPEAGAMEYDGTNLYFTPSSTRETVAFISDLSGYQLRSQITDADLVSQSDAVYGWAHGTAQRGDEMFIGTRSSPATITVFTDPNDLSSYTQNTLTGYNNLESLTYDSINDKLYGYVWNNDSHLRILSINPNDLSFTQVFDSSTINGGGSAGITNDGTYVYVVTYTNPAKFVKIRISDWTVVAQNTWANGNNGHALGLLSFDDRDELYATSSSGTSYFAKINPVDLSYSEVALSTNALTDDLSFNKVNNTYAYVYLGSEHADDSVPASSKMVRIKTDTMLADYFWGKATYVVKIIGDDLYSGSSDGAIIKYPNRDINNPKVFLTDGKKPNELFYADGKIFFTDWTSSARVYEAEFPESYVVNGTDSYSMGRNAIASGNLSTAIGFDSLISGDFSYNIGNYSEVTGSNSIAIGTNTNVSVNNSIAIGNGLKVGNIDAQIINDVADSILIGSADSSGTTQNHIRFTTGGMTFYSGVASESYISAVDGFFVNDEPVVVWGGNTLGAKKLIGTNDTYDIGFKTDNTERLTILSDGKVGINNSNPTAMLDIIASSNISPLTVSGNYNQAGTIRAQSTLNTGYSGMNMYDESGTLSASFAYGNTSANSFTNEFVFASRKSTTALKFYQGGVSAGAERIRIDASANIALLNAKVGIGTTTPATLFEIGSSDLGNGTAGPVITLGRNTNATNTGAGSINFLSKGGTAGYVWQDAAGNIRINTSAPSNANDTAGTVVGAQTSTRETKQDINDYTDYSNALSMIVNAPLHTFRYIKEVNGYGSESPLAKERIGFIADEVDPVFMVGNSIDQVSVNGILMAAIKEMDLKVKNLELNGPNTFGEYANIFFNEVVTGVESGVLYMKGLVVESIKVGSPEKRTGITLYDEVTGEPYCLSVANGNTKTVAGECGIVVPQEEVVENQEEDVNTEDNNISQDDEIIGGEISTGDEITEGEREKDISISEEKIVKDVQPTKEDTGDSTDLSSSNDSN